MENSIFVLVITSLLSGIIATVITILVQKHNENMREKRQIFSTLMAHRYLISDKENVEALNRIDAVFYKHKKVREAWSAFMDAADKSAKDPTVDQKGHLIDKYLKLLEIIADVVGYKNITWDEIKKSYFPVGLSEKITEETALRKAQIQQASAYINQDHPNPNQMTNEEMGMRVIMKALENPDGIAAIGKLMELGMKNKKGAK